MHKIFLNFVVINKEKKFVCILLCSCNIGIKIIVYCTLEYSVWYKVFYKRFKLKVNYFKN
jgi:hypothetical protein